MKNGLAFYQNNTTAVFRQQHNNSYHHTNAVCCVEDNSESTRDVKVFIWNWAGAQQNISYLTYCLYEEALGLRLPTLYEYI